MHDGLVTRRIIESFLENITHNSMFANLILDSGGKSLSSEQLKTNCFEIARDAVLTKEHVGLYPKIQIYKYDSRRHETNRFIRDIFIAVQTNARDGESSEVIGEVIEDIMDETVLRLKGFEKVVSIYPTEFLFGKSVSSNIVGVHSYQSVFRLAAHKKK